MLMHALDIIIQPTWSSTGGLQWAVDAFKAVTGYSLRRDHDALATGFDIDWDTKALVLSTHLPAVHVIIAIAMAGGVILGGQTLPPEFTGVAALANALAENPGRVVLLEEPRLRRKRAVAHKQVARLRRTGAPPVPV